MNDLREYAEHTLGLIHAEYGVNRVLVLEAALQAQREACVVAATERMEDEGDKYYDDALEDAILSAVPVPPEEKEGMPEKGVLNIYAGTYPPAQPTEEDNPTKVTAADFIENHVTGADLTEKGRAVAAQLFEEPGMTAAGRISEEGLDHESYSEPTEEEE